MEVLPITAAGVTLIAPGMAPRYVAASNDAALRFERLQTEIGQGPCVSAYETGHAVLAPDLATDDRFPRFSPPALEAGLAAVFAFPLCHSQGQLGSLDLYRETVGGLAAADMSAAQTLADVAAAYLLNAQARDDARVTSDHFRHSALHDPLTGLPNRLMLQQRLDHAAQRAQRTQTNAAILFVDLDRFKQVNDTHGHQVGDELLLAVAHRLSGLVRVGDTLARFSGDEFVFLCEDLETAADTDALADRIDAAFVEPFELAGVAVAVTASVGTAYAGPGQNISDQLLVDADVAMYQTKRKGGAGHQILDLGEARRSQDRNGLERDLRSAFANDELAVAYQPIVRVADGLVTGVEALLRWTHASRGPVSPLSMVAVAEQSGLISAIGAWVLERACHDRGQWLREHPDTPMDMAVNVSTRQMDVGIKLALDDFGTGYSSLSYLRRLPIDIVKIDRVFIAGLDHARAPGAVVEAVARLVHAFGLTVTAEGVETGRQHEQIKTFECDFAQGYHYARPMPAADFAAALVAPVSDALHLPAA